MRASILTPVLALVLLLALAPTVLAQEAGGCVDINSANAEELTRIIHIDEVRSQEMLELRPFDSVSDMTRINGIAEERLAEIRQQDLACVDPDVPGANGDGKGPDTPTGGVDTGAGGTASTGAGLSQGIFAAGGAVALGGLAAMGLRRRRA